MKYTWWKRIIKYEYSTVIISLISQIQLLSTIYVYIYIYASYFDFRLDDLVLLRSIRFREYNKSTDVDFKKFRKDLLRRENYGIKSGGTLVF